MAEHDAAGPGQAAHRDPGAARVWRTRWAGVAALASSMAVLALVSVAGSALGFLDKAACRAGAWDTSYGVYQAHCYTDIYPLYYGEQLAAGKVPYFGHHVEYPVLIGGAMQAVAWLVHWIGNPYVRGREFFDVTVVLLTLFALAGVLATGYLAGPGRRWTALLVALCPAVILAAFVNWDLIAMGLTALGMAAWAGRRHVLAGVLLGLAVATKFYPVLLFGPLLLLCLRAGRMRAFWTTFCSATAAWLVVNLPVMIPATTGWDTFYWLSETRGADWGSIWYFFESRHWPLLGVTGTTALNRLSLGLFCVACVGVAVLILAAPRRPRVPQVFFLVLAVFLMTNKVWSPQYVIWLAPLVVLARPRIWSYLVWQVAEVGYFFAIWSYLLTQVGGTGGIGSGLYFTALLARFGTVALLCVLVVKDILRPGDDVVRADGGDDPAGGVLAGAPDRLVLKLARARITATQLPGPRNLPAVSWPGGRAASGCRRAGRATPTARERPTRGPRPAAGPGRSCRWRWWRAGPGPIPARPASCCSAPGRSGR
jgi:uncharacterized membrane protein